MTTLMGTALDDLLIGGNGIDSLDGTDGNDTLIGAAGADVLAGGDGDDFFYADSTDTVIELPDAGNDTVLAARSYQLSDNVEHLQLLAGTLAVRGTGNSLANHITGNENANLLAGMDGDDFLEGGAGNDTLVGGKGDDTLAGGVGNDTYRFARNAGHDIVADAGNGQTDTLQFSDARVTHNSLWFAQSGNDLQITVLGTATSVTVEDYFLNIAHGWKVMLADGAFIDRVQIDALRAVMASIAQPVGNSIPASGIHASLSALVESTWHFAPANIALTAAVLAENSAAETFVGTLSSTDQDPGDTVVYSLLDDSGGRFAIAGSQLRVAAGAIIDFEQGSTYDVVVRATDNGGLFRDATLQVSVGNVDDQWIKLGNEVRVNAYSTSDQQEPAVAALNGGGYVIVWQSYGQDGSVEGIIGQRYDSEGATKGAQFRVNSTVANAQKLPDIAALSDGGFVVVWQSRNQDGSYEGIFAKRYNADGVAQGNEYRVNTTTQGAQTEPVVIGQNDGTYTVFWNDGSSSQKSKQFSNAGVALTGEQTVGGPDGVVAAAADGSYIRVGYGYHYSHDDFYPNGHFVNYIYAERFAANGQRIGGEIPLEDGGSTGAVTVLANGDYVVTWTKINPVDPAAVYDIFGEVLRPSGTGVSLVSSFQANTDTRFYWQTESSVVALEDGGFMVTWQTVDDVGFGIGGQRFSNTGQKIAAEFFVHSTTAGDQQFADMAGLANGDVVVTWQSGFQDGSGLGIYSQRFGTGTDLAATDILLSGSVVPEQSGLIGTLSVVDADGGDKRYVLIENPDDIFAIDGDKLIVVKRELFAVDAGNGAWNVRVGVTDVFGWLQTEKTFTVGVIDTREMFALGGEFQVNTVMADMSDPKIALLADGGYVVVWNSWNQYGDGSLDVQGQCYDSAGAPVGAQFHAYSRIIDNQFGPEVAALADGGFVVAWTTDRQDANTNGVFAQRFAADGVAQALSWQVNTYSAGNQFDPSVAALDDGFVIVWTSAVQDSSSYGVFGQRFDNAGVAAGSEFRVNTYVIGEQSAPVVQELSDGGFLVVWRSDNQSSGGAGLYAQRYDGDGAVLGGEFRLQTYPSDSHFPAQFVVLSDGNLIACWSKASDNGEYAEIVGQVFDAAGAAQCSQFLITDGRSGTVGGFDLVALDMGEFLVTWRGTSTADNRDGILAQRFSGDGIKQGPLLLVDDGLQVYNPTAAQLPDDDVIISWALSGPTGEDDTILAQRFAFDTHTGTAVADFLDGRSFAETLIGAGGADTLQGRAGHDTLIVPDTAFARVDGGPGTDTLRLSGAHLVLDLTLLPDTQVTGIERIDITGSGDNTLVLSVSEVLNVSATSDTLLVRGNEGDVVQAGPGWVMTGTEYSGGDYYDRFVQGSAVLLIEDGMTVS